MILPALFPHPKQLEPQSKPAGINDRTPNPPQHYFPPPKSEPMAPNEEKEKRSWESEKERN